MKQIATMLMLVLLCTAFSCKEDKVENMTETKIRDTSGNLNVSVLIDLSDRIDPMKYPNATMEYYLRDVGYINSVSEAFMGHVKSKRIKQMNDRIQMYFDPAPLNPDINTISKDLKFELTKDNVSNELLDKIEKAYKNDPLKLYQLAIKDNNYVGSDTWKFFQSRINDYCVEEDHRNILVILTDGYIFYENSLMKEANKTSYLTPKMIAEQGLNTPDWNTKLNGKDLGFIKANDDLSNLEILVLGINPSTKNPYEDKVIRAYWTKWFDEMKVKRYEIRTAELPSDMDGIIKGFVLNK
jgi:hypothetical protein